MMRLGEEVMRYLTIRLDTVAPSSEAEEEEGAEAEPVASEA